MQRPGATLVEVLVAIFVMAIGMIALLTLFPIGALRMAQAIQDDRCAQAATNANALANIFNIRSDNKLMGTDSNGSWDAFVDGKIGSSTIAASFPSPADVNGPSYGIFLDPAGYKSSLTPTWVGGASGNGMILRSIGNFPNTNKDILKWFSLLDDITFDPASGYPLGSPNFQRDNLYSWAYLLQRPRTSDKAVVNSCVVVFNRRPLGLTGNLNLPEAVYNSFFDPARNTITIDPTSNPAFPVALRPGNWILDSTVVPAGASTPLSPHATFYRVVGVNDLPNGHVECEVENPLRGWANVPLAAGAEGYPGKGIVLEGIAEVFERGIGLHP